MNEKHINKSLCESDSTKSPLHCREESQVSPPLRKTESKLSPLVREAESKSPLSCGSDSTKSPLPQHEWRLGVGIIPQGYKQTSIGIIPQDWEVVRLVEVANFFSGGTPLTTNRNYYNGTIPFIKSAEIYFDTTQEFLTDEGLQNSSAKWVSKGDLLFALYGANSGEVAISKIDGVINQAVLCIKNDRQISDTTFLYNYFLMIKRYLISKFLQGGQGNLSAQIIKSLQIPLPPLKEQEKIARILGVWDSAIDSLANLIKAKRKYKTALMQRLLTPPKDKSTHPLAPSAREGEQENCSHAREGLSLDSTNCESDFGKSDSTKSPLPCGGGLGVGIKTDKSPSHRPLAPYMKEFSRAMRKNPTQAENKLWQELRGKKLGFGFRRQFVIDSKYIADFVCLEKRLIIECDGGEHNQNFNDAERDFYLESQNFRILRFWNNEILGNLEGVLCVIKEALESNVDFANAKYTCESTHPLAPSAREGEQENCPRAGEGECVESPRTNEGESHQSSLRFAGFSDKWQEFRLGDICKIKKGEQLNKLSLSDNMEGKFAVINGGILPSGYTDKFNTHENTITISEGGNSCGFVNLILEKFWSGGHCYTIADSKVDTLFLFHSLKFREKFIQDLRVGSGLPNIQKKDIENFKIFIPTLAEQKKIAQVLSACDKEIETLNLKFECLKAQKKGLMQQLLSGKVRVKC